MMMEYNVLDIAELIDHFNIETDTIEEVTAAWGEEESYGLCLTTTDGYFLLVYDSALFKSKSGFFAQESSDKPYNPKDLWLDIEEWEEEPTDITRWLEEGGRLDDAHMY